jgi:hypothetical protein
MLRLRRALAQHGLKDGLVVRVGSALLPAQAQLELLECRVVGFHLKPTIHVYLSSLQVAEEQVGLGAAQ